MPGHIIQVRPQPIDDEFLEIRGHHIAFVKMRDVRGVQQRHRVQIAAALLVHLVPLVREGEHATRCFACLIDQPTVTPTTDAVLAKLGVGVFPAALVGQYQPDGLRVGVRYVD